VDPEHFAAADAAHAAGEAEQRTLFLNMLAGMVSAPVLRALRTHPAELDRLVRIVGASIFTDHPGQDHDSRLQAAVAALEAVGAIAGSVSTVPANKASAVARKAAVEARNERIIGLWATVGKNVSARQRAEIIRRRLGRHAPSIWTIFRVTKAGAK
jgi:hypothetical protein